MGTVTPDKKHSWISIQNRDEYEEFPSVTDWFANWSLGVGTNRDAVVFDWHRALLAKRVTAFIDAYNAEAYRHKANPDADWPDHIKWSEKLKKDAKAGRLAAFDESKIRDALFRPFTRKWLFLDRILNERVYQWPKLLGRVLWVKTGNEWPFFVLMSDLICDRLPQGGSQCFPLSHVNESSLERFSSKYKDASISRGDIFHYIYAILHHPVYRERYADNLKRELPRIPFAPDFHAFADAGKQLASLHLNYESIEPWPLEYIEQQGVSFSEHVTKMKLSKDRTSIQVNESLTLGGIPTETFNYRLGSKSAREWIMDQYQVKGDSNPNREDDPGYIVRLVSQIVRVSLETVRIVNALPPFLTEANV